MGRGQPSKAVQMLHRAEVGEGTEEACESRQTIAPENATLWGHAEVNLPNRGG